ncbi:CGNR zinc finger domain-containing protein [Nonomuraea sp. NPDC049684]|uniref:CGNR zinc finger domain-containing protein n=1 Tax=Nonomuraea sp. NPDC049684 TaxID=3364356 RepID=UPI0037B6BB0D
MGAGSRPGWRGCVVDRLGNRSGSWWSMRVCGDNSKTRAYRARKRGSRRLQGSNTDTV